MYIECPLWSVTQSEQTLEHMKKYGVWWMFYDGMVMNGWLNPNENWPTPYQIPHSNHNRNRNPKATGRDDEVVNVRQRVKRKFSNGACGHYITEIIKRILQWIERDVMAKYNIIWNSKIRAVGVLTFRFLGLFWISTHRSLHRVFCPAAWMHPPQRHCNRSQPNQNPNRCPIHSSSL